MKCPDCGIIIPEKIVGTEQYDGQYFEYYEGCCPCCLTAFEWYDTYEYTETSAPVPIDPNDHP